MHNPQQSGVVGRVLRLILGIALLVIVWPFWHGGGWGFLIRTGSVLCALAAFYVLLAVFLKRRGSVASPGIFACLALLPLLAVFLLGTGGGLIFGSGEGQLAVLTYLGLSLVLAAVTADRGCEVLTLPRLLVRGPVTLPCVAFHLTDRLEDRFAKRGSRFSDPPGGG